MFKRFAKIATGSDGRQVLMYIAPNNGAFILHQIVQLDEIPGCPQIDCMIPVATQKSSEKNELQAYSMLESADQEVADEIIKAAVRFVTDRIVKN